MKSPTLNLTDSDIDRFFADKKRVAAYKARVRYHRDYISDLANAKAEGRAEGLKQAIEEGREEGRAEANISTARECIKLGLDTSTICKITHLTPKAVEALRKAS